MAEVLWTPSEAAVRQTRMTAFTDWLSRRTGRAFPGYQALHQWSIGHVEGFWEAYLEFTGVIAHAPHQQVLSARAMPGAQRASLPSSALTISRQKLSAFRSCSNSRFTGWIDAQPSRIRPTGPKKLWRKPWKTLHPLVMCSRPLTDYP
jgi:hypothetical protein